MFRCFLIVSILSFNQLLADFGKDYDEALLEEELCTEREDIFCSASFDDSDVNPEIAYLIKEGIEQESLEEGIEILESALRDAKTSRNEKRTSSIDAASYHLARVYYKKYSYEKSHPCRNTKCHFDHAKSYYLELCLDALENISEYYDEHNFKNDAINIGYELLSLFRHDYNKRSAVHRQMSHFATGKAREYHESEALKNAQHQSDKPEECTSNEKLESLFTSEKDITKILGLLESILEVVDDEDSAAEIKINSGKIYVSKIPSTEEEGFAAADIEDWYQSLYVKFTSLIKNYEDKNRFKTLAILDDIIELLGGVGLDNSELEKYMETKVNLGKAYLWKYVLEEGEKDSYVNAFDKAKNGNYYQKGSDIYNKFFYKFLYFLGEDLAEICQGREYYRSFCDEMRLYLANTCDSGSYDEGLKICVESAGNYVFPPKDFNVEHDIYNLGIFTLGSLMEGFQFTWGLNTKNNRKDILGYNIYLRDENMDGWIWFSAKEQYNRGEGYNEYGYTKYYHSIIKRDHTVEVPVCSSNEYTFKICPVSKDKTKHVLCTESTVKREY